MILFAHAFGLLSCVLGLRHPSHLAARKHTEVLPSNMQKCYHARTDPIDAFGLLSCLLGLRHPSHLAARKHTEVLPSNMQKCYHARTDPIDGQKVAQHGRKGKIIVRPPPTLFVRISDWQEINYIRFIRRRSPKRAKFNPRVPAVGFAFNLHARIANHIH